MKTQYPSHSESTGVPIADLRSSSIFYLLELGPSDPRDGALLVAPPFRMSRNLQNIHGHAGPGHGRCAEPRGGLSHHDIGRDDEGTDGGRVAGPPTAPHRRVYNAVRNPALVVSR